jgi:hypothetical protein
MLRAGAATSQCSLLRPRVGCSVAHPPQPNVARKDHSAFHVQSVHHDVSVVSTFSFDGSWPIQSGVDGLQAKVRYIRWHGLQRLGGGRIKMQQWEHNTRHRNRCERSNFAAADGNEVRATWRLYDRTRPSQHSLRPTETTHYPFRSSDTAKGPCCRATQ